MKVCEIYESIQGEGPNTGEPTTFLRFGGCNLRCPGWGKGTLPDGREVPGCDTVFAVYPEWRDTWDSKSVREIVDSVPSWPRRVCLTGGEPLIQPSKRLLELYQGLRYEGHTIDLFTNGTQLLPTWAMGPSTTVVMDYKLPGSGEFGSFLEENFDKLNPKDALKFVCKGEEDFDMALHVIETHEIYAQIYFGVVWGISESWLAGKMKQYELPYMMNMQTHKFVWGDVRGT